MSEDTDNGEEKNNDESSAEAVAEKSRFNAEMYSVPATDPRNADDSSNNTSDSDNSDTSDNTNSSDAE